MFYTRPHKSKLYDYAQQVYRITARNFDEVYAEATQGGWDKAKLHDGVVPDPLAVGTAGTLAFLIAGCMALLGYLLIVGTGLMIRRNF